MECLSREPVDIIKLFEEKKFLKVCAPMVRYSKLQFRTLLKEYGCDLCFTPMILADSFWKSQKARDNEFTTNKEDKPLVVQFAANNPYDFVRAANMVSPYSDGVDLNCGCPQRWAKQMGVGCILLDSPETIADIVSQCRNQICKQFTVSVKTRILKDVRKTVNICKQLENAGASFLSIHGRTPSQSSGDIDENILKLITENVNCPVIANGGITTLEECVKLQERINCQGVMVANGLLTNPTLFSGSNSVTLDCIQKWIDICYNSTLSNDTYTLESEQTSNGNRTIPERPKNLTYQCFHHHLVFMLEKFIKKRKRRIFNSLTTFQQALKFLHDEFGLVPQLYSRDKFNQYFNLNLSYPCQEDLTENYHQYENSDGKFFESKLHTENTEIDTEFMDLFDETKSY